MVDDDLFGITKYEGWTENGLQVYGCRGIGNKYRAFYRECWPLIRNDVMWENDDWPWHYFALNRDGKLMLETIMKLYYPDDEIYLTKERK